MKPGRNGRLICLALELCMLLVVAGCGSGGGSGGNTQGTAPTIANLNYSPSSAQLNDGGGSAIVTGTIDFTDPDGDVFSFTIATFTSAGQPLSTTTTPIQSAAGSTSGAIAVSVAVPTTTIANYTFQVFITDAAGHASNQISGTFSVVAGSPANLVTPTGPSPAGLVVLNGALYWSEAGEEPVNGISLAGGSPPFVLAQKIGTPAGFVVQGQDVFWLDERSGISPSGCTGPGVIRILNRTPTNGTMTTELARGDSCAGGSPDLVVDGGFVYWVTSTASPNTYVIWKTPVAGGASTAVTTTSVPVVALTGMAGNIYWMENFFPIADGAIRAVSTTGGPAITLASGFISRAGTFAVNSTSVFYTVANFPGSDNLLKVPVTGGPATQLGLLNTPPQKLAADDTNIYWIDSASISALPVAGGSTTILANAVNTPLDLVVRASDVLWSETTGPAHGETGAVRSVQKTGGAVAVLAQGGDAPRRLGWDASWVYWNEGGPIGLIEGFGRIARIPTAGGAVETVVAGVTSDSPPITVSDTHVFIADKFRIKRVPLSGGVVETVAAAYDNVVSIITDGAYVYWVEGPLSNVRRVPNVGGTVENLADSGVNAGPAGPIRLQSGMVYWMTNFNTILVAPATGGATQVIASGLPFLSDFVVDATDIYFSEHDTGNMKKMPLGGGGATTLANNGLGYGSYSILAMDDINLYWIDQAKIGRVSKTGATPSFIVPGSLASDPLFPASIALDTTSVYWTEPPIGEIWKALK